MTFGPRGNLSGRVQGKLSGPRLLLESKEIAFISAADRPMIRKMSSDIASNEN